MCVFLCCFFLLLCATPNNKINKNIRECFKTKINGTKCKCTGWKGFKTQDNHLFSFQFTLFWQCVVDFYCTSTINVEKYKNQNVCSPFLDTFFNEICPHGPPVRISVYVDNCPCFFLHNARARLSNPLEQVPAQITNTARRLRLKWHF